MVALYALLVFKPTARVTHRVVRSPLLLSVLAAAYALVLAAAAQAGFFHTLAAIGREVATSVAAGSPDVTSLGRVFSSPVATLLSWIHLMMLDFYQARAVWLDGLDHGVPTRHSVALCFFVGPLGLLSHIMTRSIVTPATRGT